MKINYIFAQNVYIYYIKYILSPSNTFFSKEVGGKRRDEIMSYLLFLKSRQATLCLRK